MVRVAHVAPGLAEVGGRLGIGQCRRQTPARLHVCVRVCVCERVCVRACVRACVCVHIERARGWSVVCPPMLISVLLRLEDRLE